MSHRELAQDIKTKNIIEMALAFTAMMRVFSERSNAAIGGRLAQLFARLDRIAETEDYERAHTDFCNWFTQTVRTAEKTLKNGRIKPSGASSYGQAAKVLDISAKVYVYYCAQPSDAAGRRLVPMLHGAVDTPIMRFLASRYPEVGVRSKTIQEVDREEYERLQSLVARDIEASFQSQIYPVQYDDIMWRRLNRAGTPANQGMHPTGQNAAGG